MQGFLESTAYRHHLTHRFHLRGKAVVGLGKFLEGKARYLGDHIIYAGLKRRWGSATRDVIFQFIQRITDGEFGRHFGDRKTGCLGGQRRRTRHAWVHLDHDHAPVFWISAELHIGATCVHADLTQHRNGGVAHDLVFLVGERLRWRDGNGIPSVHAHGIKIFDRADDDAIIFFIAHYLHLEFFPADQ